MKSKLTISSLAIGNLIHRKKQYTLMIIGILVSMILSNTVLFFVSSMSSSVKEYYKNNYGNNSSINYNKYLTDNHLKEAKERGIIDSYAYAHVLGKLYPEKDSEELELNVAYLDEECKDLYYVSLLEGEYPDESGEIALEKATLAQLNPNLKIGDTFTVFMRGQNDDELLDSYEEVTFKLTGILRNKRSTIYSHDAISADYLPSAFVADDSIALKGSKEAKVAYVNTNSDSFDWLGYVADLGIIHESEPNLFVMTATYKDNFKYTTTYRIMVLGVIFGVVLLLASFIAITNAMNSNITDRKKQIGMLRTVGATKRQIRKIFGREAIIISLICMPISLVTAFLQLKLYRDFSVRILFLFRIFSCLY